MRIIFREGSPSRENSLSSEWIIICTRHSVITEEQVTLWIIIHTPTRYLIYLTVHRIDYYPHTPYTTLWRSPLRDFLLPSPLLIRGISTLPQGAQYFESNFFPKKWVRGGYFINKIFRFFSEN